jgi:hypothetical protein
MARRAFRRYARVAGLSALVALVAVAALVTLQPDAYLRTAPIGPGHPARTRFDEEVINGILNVLADSSGGTRLDVTITEEMMNARLVAALAAVDAGGMPLPGVLRNVRIAFEPGSIVVATRLGRGHSEVVLSQRLRLAATPDGRLAVQTVALRAGMMPVPRSLCGQVSEALREHVARLKRGGAGEDSLLLWRAALAALEGEPIALRGTKRGIFLEKVEVERGRLHATGRRAG